MAKRKIIPTLSEDQRARFWALVDCSTNDECWLWQGTKGKPPHHYGAFFPTSNDAYRAHRVVWHMVHGDIPTGLDVLHTCDNPPCCNIEHLFLGTHAENMRDCLNKGRGNRVYGEAVGTAKLSDAAVLYMRSLYANGEASTGQLAVMFDVHKKTASKAVKGQQWKHLPLVEDHPDAEARRAECVSAAIGAALRDDPLTDAQVQQVIEKHRDERLSGSIIAEQIGVTRRLVYAALRREYGGAIPRSDKMPAPYHVRNREARNARLRQQRRHKADPADI